MSDLEIDSDDLFVYIAQCFQMFLKIHLDYIEQKAERFLQLFTGSKRIDVGLIYNVIKSTLFVVEKVKGKQYDIVVDLDIISPLRNLADVEGTINQEVGDKKCNFAYSEVESGEKPLFYYVFVEMKAVFMIALFFQIINLDSRY